MTGATTRSKSACAFGAICRNVAIVGAIALGSLGGYLYMYSPRSWSSLGWSLSANVGIPVPLSVQNDAAQLVRAQGRLFFLFMLEDHLPHSNVWSAFFSAAPTGSYDAVAHCTRKDACEKSPEMRRMGIHVIDTVPTKPCVDMVSPIYQMLRKAIATAGRADFPIQKFIVVSDSTLPLKSLNRMREILLRSSSSDICPSPPEEWAFSQISGTRFYVVKHHQWVILSRRHADIFVENWQKLSQHSSFVTDGQYTVKSSDFKWLVPRMGSDGFANSSDAFPRGDIKVSRCPEEEVFTTLIFGLFEDKMRSRWRALLSVGKCRTYVNWKCANPPEKFSQVTPLLRQMALNTTEDGYLFAGRMDLGASFDELTPLIVGRR